MTTAPSAIQMARDGRATAINARDQVAPLVALACLAVAAASIGLPGRSLWLDELLSVTFAGQGPAATLPTVLRFDVHPPLYYLQLSLWMLAGRGEAWLMANSILWHAAAVVLLARGAGHFYGRRVGHGAALLLALSPAALAYADQLRMYAFLGFLLVAAWYVQQRWLEGSAGRFGGALLLLCQLAVAYTHTAGVLMLSGVVALGGLTLLRRGDPARLWRWLAIEAAVGLLSLPGVAIGMLRGVSHLERPDAAAAWAVWEFLAGAAWAGGVGPVLAILVAGLLVAGCLRDRQLILPVATLVALPLVLAAGLSHLARPIWIERIFVPLLPFLCLCLARASLGAGRWQPAARMAFYGLLALWAATGIAGQLTRSKGDGFGPVAQAVRTAEPPSGLVLVVGDFTYWCFLWYFAGPNWGDPRQAFTQNPDWDAMLARLPAPVVAGFGLGDGARRLQVGGVTAALWDGGALPAAQGDVLLLRSWRAATPPLPGYVLQDRRDYPPVVLERWRVVP